MAKTKERLDNVLVERGLVPTRAKAKGLIMAREVKVNGEIVDKAGTVRKHRKYESRNMKDEG